MQAAEKRAKIRTNRETGVPGNDHDSWDAARRPPLYIKMFQPYRNFIETRHNQGHIEQEKIANERLTFFLEKYRYELYTYKVNTFSILYGYFWGGQVLGCACFRESVSDTSTRHVHTVINWEFSIAIYYMNVGCV